MNVALIAISGITLSLPFVTHAGATASPPSDLSVESIEFDQQTGTLSVNFANSGKNVVTAFGIKVTAEVGGTPIATFRSIEELLPLVVSTRLRKGDPTSWEGALLPGQHYSDKVPISPDLEKEAQFTAVVTGISFSNGRSWSTDPETIRTIDAERAATVRCQEGLLRIVRSAPPNANREERISGIRRGFKSLHANALASKGTPAEISETDVQWAIQELDRIGELEDSDDALQKLGWRLQFSRNQIALISNRENVPLRLAKRIKRLL